MKAFLPLLVILGAAGATCPAMAGPLEDGLASYERRDFTSAREVLAPVAAAGNAKAQLVLGKIYLDGQGVALNGLIAAKWYRRAAEQGDAEAQARLGVLYLRGRGVRQDYRESAKWLELAARQGNIDAQQCLAGLYVTGEGVSKDLVLAHALYSLAAVGKKDNTATRNRDFLAAKLTAEEVARSARLQGAWRPEGAPGQ